MPPWRHHRAIIISLITLPPQPLTRRIGPAVWQIGGKFAAGAGAPGVDAAAAVRVQGDAAAVALLGAFHADQKRRDGRHQIGGHGAAGLAIQFALIKRHPWHLATGGAAVAGIAGIPIAAGGQGWGVRREGWVRWHGSGRKNRSGPDCIFRRS